MLCTLSKLVGDNHVYEEALISVGENLGVSREDTKMIITNWDDVDVMNFAEHHEKISFVRHCLVELTISIPQSTKMDMCKEIAEELGVPNEQLN